MRIGIDVRIENPAEPGQWRNLWRLGAWVAAHGHGTHFGDSWEHSVVLEKILPSSEHPTPYCLGGKRACPPEDSGGPWGYAHFLEAITDAQHPEHRDYLEWVGGSFDPEAFDRDEVSAELSVLRRRGSRGA